MFSGSESVRLVADHPGLVVEPFDRAVIDGHMKPGQDVLLMAANHPGKFANGLQPGMRGHQNHCLRYFLALAFVLQDHRSRKPSLRRQALLIFKFISSRLLSPARCFGVRFQGFLSQMYRLSFMRSLCSLPFSRVSSRRTWSTAAIRWRTI